MSSSNRESSSLAFLGRKQQMKVALTRRGVAMALSFCELIRVDYSKIAPALITWVQLLAAKVAALEAK